MKLNHLIPAIFFLVLFGLTSSYSQNTKRISDVFVDEKGVMRWANNDEIYGFGVNYSVPFAHAYRSAKRMGVNIKQAIDQDIYHFKRLGFDLYRIHVWDTEISDVEGNLLENEHLDAFDYLLKKLKENGINYVITPIAFWGNGWPEPDEETPGFSYKYGKGECLTDPACIKAQQNYLFQFLNHVNPYTGLAYKEDPSLIAVEISNEPHHRGEAEKVTEFVKGMTKAVRRTGIKKPIFYNMSHGVHFAEDYFKGSLDGGTFQWYPTGLGYQRELQGNLLPNVDTYKITFDKVFKANQGAKLVYEFDAADVGKSYIYPAMARSFRTAGIQIATHFAYDPTYLAPFNTEYNTHYMNLAYTPKKALSLKISGEVFHEVPLYSDYGIYPDNTKFENTTVDYDSDLAIYDSGAKYFYTNSTDVEPRNESQIIEIAGYGNSPLVKYSGTGAYFLDRIAPHMWRLEVMPDAIWVADPFGKNSFDKTVGVIKWTDQEMTIKLSDLGTDFKLKAINDGNSFATDIEGQTFMIRPGTYVLSGKKARSGFSPDDDFKGSRMGDYFAPESNVDTAWLRHEPALEVSEGSETIISAQFISPSDPSELVVVGFNGSERFSIIMESYLPYQYRAVIPKEKLKPGYLNYFIVVRWDGEESGMTFPASKRGKPFDWDFHNNEPYRIPVVPKQRPIELFNAQADTEFLVRQWRPSFKLVPTEHLGQSEYQMNILQLFRPDNENLNADPIYDYSFKHFIFKRIKEREDDLSGKDKLVFLGRALNDKNCKLQIALVMDDGSAFGNVLEIQPEIGSYTLKLSDLKPVKTVTLPRPYPTFLPYYFVHKNESTFDINRVESIQFSIGPGLAKEERFIAHGIGLISVWLE
ncbi:MAG: hypothetical protein KJO00_03575 [Bacteroidia bacterium]|nr:hypothetical protein [Bacteroidia bacterium]